MYNYKIKFTKKTGIEDITDEKAFELIDDYFGTLDNNGQVVGGFDLFSDDGGNIFLTVVLPENDRFLKQIATDM